MQQKILQLAKEFNIAGEIKHHEIINSGHINTTIKVSTLEGNNNKDYIFQKINKYVFKNPEEVMQNIEEITTHIKTELSKKGKNSKRRVLEFYTTKNGRSFFKDELGEYWRVYQFVKNSKSYDNCNNLEVITQAGMAFGEFQSLLNNYPIEKLNITIPNFHNVQERYKLFKTIAGEDRYNRLGECIEQAKAFLDLESVVTQLNFLQQQNKLKTRVTHNDTKCNNVLFDKHSNEFLCVIDLDTVMPGIVASDFGDAIRSIANTASEDETQLDKVKLDLQKFRAFSTGFLSKAKKHLSQTEIDTLALGAITITTECGLRFLTDYLDGDKYFKIDYPEHNLDRAKCQLALAQDMIKNHEQMQTIIKQCAKEEKTDFENECL